jgi:hypothetical protein
MLSMLQDAGFDARIGVYVCHCGLNIAGVVDVEAVRESARFLEGVVVVRECGACLRHHVLIGRASKTPGYSPRLSSEAEGEQDQRVYLEHRST